MQGSVASTPHLRSIGSVLTIGSVAAILFATMLPDSGQPVDSHLCLVCGTIGGVDSVLNVLLFFPLGVGLALSGIPWNRSVLTACLISLTVETTQLFFIPGRDATLGDVLTNTVGGLLGYVVARNASIWLRPPPRFAAILGLCWCGVWITIQAISSFAFAPSIPDSRYYGQIAPRLGDFALFPGRVLAARIDGVPITDTRLNDIDSVGRRLLGGATVAAKVVPGGPTSDIAPIVRVADDEQREIVLLAQDEQSLLFGIRTRAAIFRLRPLLFAMTGVFPDGVSRKNSFGVSKKNYSATVPLSLSGSYDGREARLAVRSDSATDERRVSVSSSLGWTLALPFQWAIEDTRAEVVVSWIWMAFLMVPTGYWGAQVARHSSSHANATLVVLCLLGVAILIAGLVPLQHAFGLPAAPIRDWFASISGIFAGGTFALCAENIGRGGVR
jgi:hypothetical protein